MNFCVAFEAKAFRLHVVLKGASFALQEWGDFGPCSVTCGRGSRGFGPLKLQGFELSVDRVEFLSLKGA